MKSYRLFLLLGSLLLAYAPTYAREYRNESFGFSAQVPDWMMLCTTPMPGPNHGFVALTGFSDCNDLLNRPRLELFVEYNVPHEAEKPESLADDACSGQAKATEVTSGGSAIYECLHVVSDGLNRRRYFLLRKKPKKWVGEWVVVYLSIYSDRDISLTEMRLARDLLTRIRWFERR